MMSGTPFNRAVDQVIAFYPDLNRNKLAEHTLKWIANQYWLPLTALNRAVLVCDFFYKVLKIGFFSQEKGGATPLTRFFAIVCMPGYSIHSIYIVYNNATIPKK